MNIIQSFYDNMADSYDKLFLDWNATTKEQALILDKLFREQGFDRTATVLDCACGIGTQAIGLAAMGYSVTASDISCGELAQAQKRAEKNRVEIRFENADFCALDKAFSQKFDIIICMDNALPRMLSHATLESAIQSIMKQMVGYSLPVSGITMRCFRKSPPTLPRTFTRQNSGSGSPFRPGHGRKTATS